jgi:hypothetical protein
MRKKSYQRWLFLAALAVMPCGAATIHVEIFPGTAAPPATLGGYVMQAFPTEMRPEFTMVSDAAAPAGGTLSFDSPVELDHIGGLGWGSWSHGYTGSVYQTYGDHLSLVFPADTQAFYFYLQPAIKALFEFTVDAQGISTPLSINGNGGAQYVGIYIDDIASSLTGVSILQPNGLSDGFAVGEFGIDGGDINVIPEPGNLLGLGCVLASGLMVRNRRRRSNP